MNYSGENNIFENEYKKYLYIKKKLEHMLSNEEIYTEKEWQKEIAQIMTLIFSKYSNITDETTFKTNEGDKRIDFIFVDFQGNIDVVEIKKSHGIDILSKAAKKANRNNYVPSKQLISAVMQTEKYLYHLNRNAEKSELKIKDKFLNDHEIELPIKIRNPQGIIILGRSINMNSEQLSDYEIIKRQYKHIAEIISYDDLVNRGGYVDLERKHVMGFFEENLMQINTYVIDIDCAKDLVSSDDILLAGIDLGVTPTLIVESPNGYQAYFVLDRPSFVSKAHDYKSLRTNKAIARSLKLAFSKEIDGVDFGCNPFGIFRFPNEENIVFYEPENVFSFKTLMAWSMKVSDDHQQEQQELHMQKFMTSDFKQTQTSWFRSLLKQSDIKGGKGVLGRNSALFTASLACYSSQLDQDACIELMTEFNASLTYPLSEKELKKTIRSAYSGRYKGASAQYIQLLNEQWGSDDTRAESLNKGVWYKFAKPRDDRQKSHYSEWRKDLIRLIEQKATKQLGFVQLTRKELIKELNIPESSLKDLLRLKQLGSLPKPL